jgi:hypothetical protein
MAWPLTPLPPAAHCLQHDWIKENGVASDNVIEPEVLKRMRGFAAMNKVGGGAAQRSGSGKGKGRSKGRGRGKSKGKGKGRSGMQGQNAHELPPTHPLTLINYPPPPPPCTCS